jgi:hypothetical protein
MENWQTIFLGLKQLPRELSAFEIEAFFTFSEAERATIAARRRPALQLGAQLSITPPAIATDYCALPGNGCTNIN